MDRMKKTLLAASAVLSVAAVAVPVATALEIEIFDRLEDRVRLFANGGDVTPNGPLGESQSISYDVVVPGTYSHVLVRFIIREPTTSDVSDILLLSVGTGTFLQFQFQSDANSPLAYVPDPTLDMSIDETGLQTVYSSTDSGGIFPPLVIRISSDVETPVPEPATLALLGLGLAGLGFSRRRKSN